MNTMKRIIVLLTILALSSLACADPTADSISVSSASGDPGATNVLVLVNIANVIDGPIQVITFDVIYDSNVIELVKAKRGSDLPRDEDDEPTWSVKLGTNKKRITMSTDDQDYALTDGTTGNTVKLYFDVKSTATPGQTSPIELSNVDISSTGLVHGTIPAINGDFTVTGEVPEPLLCTNPDPPSHDFGNVQEGETRKWTFNVTNCGEGTLEWTVSGDQTWITVDPTGGSTTTETVTVTVTIDTTGLSDVTHTGTVTVTSDYGTKTGTITVDVQSTQEDPQLCTIPNPPSHDFGSVPESETQTWTFDVTNCGTGTLDWSVSVSDNRPWITIDPASGSATTETDTVTVTIDTAGLAAGSTYSGDVTVTSDYGTKTGTISVSIPIGQEYPQLCTTPDPPSHDFGSVPESETQTWTFDVTNCGAGTLTWTVSDDQSWITVSPTSGTDAGTVTVTINTAGLSPGTHTGTVTVESNGGTKTGTITVKVKGSQPSPPPADVPTFTPLGMLAMVSLLGVAGMSVIRRR